MNTVKKIEKVSDKEKIAQLEREKLEYLANLFADHEEVINESINYIPLSISDWVRSYVLSPEFQELDREK